MRTERDVLMMVENHIIAVQCYPVKELWRLDDARKLIREYLAGTHFCDDCEGSGWKVVDHVICLPCDGTGRVVKETKK